MRIITTGKELTSKHQGEVEGKRKKQKTENRKQKTENRKQKTE